MRTERRETKDEGTASWIGLILVVIAVLMPSTARAQVQIRIDSSQTDNLPTDKGQLSLSTVRLQLTSGSLEIVFVPLDERILRLLTRDSYLSMERLMQQQQKSLDSVATVAGVTAPGLAFVSFDALAPSTRFDPQLLTVTFHGQQFRPVGWVALSPAFSSQQLGVREQVQAIMVFQRGIPVKEGFTLNYLDATNDTWESRLSRFDGERSRILGSARSRADTTHR